MEKEKLLKISILSIIVIIVILLSLLIVILNKDSVNNNLIVQENEIQTGNKEETQELDDSTTFFTIESCIANYLNYCQIDEEEISNDIYYDEAMTKEDKILAIYNMLDKNYINTENITVETIEDKITLYKDLISFQMIKIKKLNNENIVLYAVYGKVEKQENLEKIQDVYFIINMDITNKIFSLTPLNKNNITSIDEIKLEQHVNQIEKNNYNSYINMQLTDLQKARRYFENFKNRILLQPKDAYELLQEEYRETKYNDVEQFKNYISLNIKYLKSIQMVDYTLSQKENYTIYKCKDQYGNTYIFKETAIMEYTVQLDDYTLENEEFNERYEKADSRDKGILNVDKFFKMINMQDYTSAYSVLDENFKQNYFKTQAEFENYIKSKLFRYNKVDYKEYSNKITDIYTYKVVLTDITEENSNEVEFNIVMKLLEGTEFVMSFEVN